MRNSGDDSGLLSHWDSSFSPSLVLDVDAEREVSERIAGGGGGVCGCLSFSLDEWVSGDLDDEDDVGCLAVDALVDVMVVACQGDFGLVTESFKTRLSGRK